MQASQPPCTCTFPPQTVLPSFDPTVARSQRPRLFRSVPRHFHFQRGCSRRGVAAAGCGCWASHPFWGAVVRRAPPRGLMGGTAEGTGRVPARLILLTRALPTDTPAAVPRSGTGRARETEKLPVSHAPNHRSRLIAGRIAVRSSGKDCKVC
eukprot:gene14945-biopygen20152